MRFRKKKRKIQVKSVNVSKTKAMFGCGNQQELLFVRQELIGVVCFLVGDSKVKFAIAPFSLTASWLPSPRDFSSHCAGIHQISNTVSYIFKNLHFLWMFKVSVKAHILIGLVVGRRGKGIHLSLYPVSLVSVNNPEGVVCVLFSHTKQICFLNVSSHLGTQFTDLF